MNPNSADFSYFSQGALHKQDLMNFEFLESNQIDIKEFQEPLFSSENCLFSPYSDASLHQQSLNQVFHHYDSQA